MQWCGCRTAVLLHGVMLFCLLGAFWGCAGPGSPKPPSLQLPEPARNLTAVRSGDTVQIRFEVSARTTDGVLLRDTMVHGTLCRQIEKGGPCTPVDADETSADLPVPRGSAPGEPVTWTDRLPTDLARGPVRVLRYRVELRNAAGRSAGPSDPVYAAAGEAPPQVESFSAAGTRLGILLQWKAADEGADLLLRREDLGGDARPAKHRAPTPAAPGRRSVTAPHSSRSQADASPGTVWLQTEPGRSASSQILDGSVQEGVPYRYLAVRRITAVVGGRSLELRSTPSAPVEIVWKDAYPPPAPGGLTALGFTTPANSGTPGVYAVDLIWQPVNDPRVTGYTVSRQPLGVNGEPQAPGERLTAQPLVTPAFHDSSADRAKAYRYSVTAVDARGNSSAPAEATVQPQPAGR